MDKSLGTLAFLCCFPIHTGPTPPLTLQTKLDAYIQIFFQFQLCIGWREGELQENFKNNALFYKVTQKWQKNMNIALVSQGLLSMIVWILVFG